MLRETLEGNREEVTGDWRTLHREELHGVTSLPKIQAIKSRKVRWGGHVARMCTQNFGGET